MRAGSSIAALVGASVGLAIDTSMDGTVWLPSRDEVTFLPIQPEPLTKRQRRRMRGKRKSA